MVEVKGMQELIDKIQKINDSPNKIARKVLNKAGDYVRDVESECAYQAHRPYSTDTGYKEVKKLGIRSYKGGSKFIDIGIRDGKTDWSKVKGIYFNNYGFYHVKSGRFIAGSNWIGTAYEKSSDRAYDIIKDGILKEMDL